MCIISEGLQRIARKEVICLERAVFMELADRYKDTIFRVALNMLGSPADADDIVQETLIRLLERREPFENEKHAKYWLIRVTINLCKNALCSPWRWHSPLEAAETVPVLQSQPSYCPVIGINRCF